jgi:hypothetical protein
MLSCAVAIVLVAAPAAALATTQTSTSGAVTATFTFTTNPKNDTYPTKTLTISRAGQVLYNHAVTSKYCGPSANAQPYCAPGVLGSVGSSVHVLDLEHTGEPDVVVDLYTGGAHCCFIEQVYSFAPSTGSYGVSEHDFGDPGARIVDLGHDGRYQFLTADDAFAYRFTDFAASGLPIQILTFAHGRFTNVTRRYPKLIAKDAAFYFKAFKRFRSDNDGFVAAWAADEYNLGHRALVSSVLAKELKAGKLHSAQYPSAKKFVAALKKFLRREGYVH